MYYELLISNVLLQNLTANNLFIYLNNDILTGKLSKSFYSIF
jgi:hypothetical protein